jgi:peptidoglycan/xylan/chitin deacetylase (PgdA/CDA1 family)
LDYDGIVSEMGQLATALKSIIGVSPTYMRPPYFYTNAAVLETLGGLGYHVIEADIDTKDYENDSEALIQNAVNTFDAGIDAGGSIESSHDIHQWTANVLVQAMIDKVKSKGLTRKIPAFFWY